VSAGWPWLFLQHRSRVTWPVALHHSWCDAPVQGPCGPFHSDPDAADDDDNNNNNNNNKRLKDNSLFYLRTVSK